ncbi:non-ribosomal peptide synthetase [Serratia oryzae]|uniref:non-ribosomal peptide synthetase n=1 Tax=Serratia oryzae TaxID=2034155 RepID=UPI0009FA50C9
MLFIHRTATVLLKKNQILSNFNSFLINLGKEIYMHTLSATPYTRIFFTEWQLEPLSSKYNMIMDQTITGSLDIHKLERAVKYVIHKYPVLHSHLVEEDGQLLWRRNAETCVTGLERCNSLEALAELATRPFDLNNGPLFSYGFYHDKENEVYEFVLVMHHVIIDGLSVADVYTEMSDYYNDSVTAENHINDNRFFLERGRDYLDKLNELSTANPAEYWQKALTGLPKKNEIPYVHLPDSTPINRQVKFLLPLRKWEVLKRNVKHANAFLVFKTIWALLIARYCQSEAAHIAYPVSMESGSHLSLGAQVNTAVFPFFVHQGDSFADIYQRTLAHNRSLKAKPGLRFTRWPIYEVLKNSGIRPNVSFAQAHFNELTLALTGCQTRCNHRFDQSLANAELVLEYQEQSGDMAFRIRYEPELFAPQQIAAMAEQFQYLLNQLLLHPDKPLESFPLLTPAQQREQLIDWNPPQSKQAMAPGTLHQAITEQAKKYPQRIALIDERQQLTYLALEQKSSCLARRIKEHYQRITQESIGPDTLIPLCLNRGVDMIVTMLAIMKTGAAYIPLEPQLPKQRINYILADSGARLLITEQGLRAKLQDMALPVELGLVDDPADSGATSDVPLAVESSPHQMAYAIYTSGTTGQPKGALLEHQGVLNMVREFQAILGHSDKARCCLQFASVVFDAHVAETYIALCGGHTLVVASEEQRHDLPALLALIEQHHIEFAHLPPALLKLKPNIPACLSQIVVAGEATSRACLDHYTQLGHQLFNGYGPSEASVCVAINLYRYNGANTIGRPLPGVRLYVLDSQQRPLPIGVPGELCVSGVGLARGYLNQPLLTQEKFIANPFAQADESEYQRLYRTGDRVRWLPNGELEYVGRDDFQVKIHGHRIELSEIEQAFVAVTSVAHCAVVVRGQEETPRIVAYYVAEVTLNDEQVKRQLAERLPDYMVPAVLVQLMSLPLTINGKLDMRALPEPGYSQACHDYRPATTYQEKQLQAVWQQVMGLEDIGLNDDFLRLGGDSITAIRLVSEMRRIGMVCRTQDLYHYRSIAALLDNLATTALPNAVQAEQGILSQDIPLSPTQLWFFEQEFAHSHYWNQSFLIRVPELDLGRLQQAIDALAVHHDMLRAYFTLEQQGYRQHYQEQSAPRTLLRCHRTELSDAELEALFSAWQSGFDYQQGPLWQFGYVEGYQDGSARIFFACHHLIIDAVSWRILVEDLRRLYLGEALGPKSASYRQWVNALLDYEPTGLREADYWQQQCEQQRDYRADFALSDRLNLHYGQLDSMATGKLMRMSGQTNDLLLTAWLRTLRHYSNTHSHTLMLESHGRDLPGGHLDVGRTLGWFTALYPVNFTLADNPQADVAQVRAALEAVPNQGIGYGVLRVRGGEHRPALRHPGVIFNYLGQFTDQGAEWQLLAEPSGQNSDPTNTNRELLILNSWVADETLCFRLDGMLTAAALLDIAQQFTHQVQQLIEQDSGAPVVMGEELPATLWQRLQQSYTPQAIFPCNSLQQGFIYHAVSQPDDPSYRVQMVLDYLTELNPDTYRQAWEMAVVRFPILRTCFNWQWQPLQVICAETAIDWHYEDYQQQENWQQALDQLCEQQRVQPFDLQQPGLFRLRLVQISAQHYCLVYTVHHSITDGWSGQLLLKYVHQAYQQLLAGQQPDSQQEVTYLLAQRYYMEQAEHCRAYWQQRQLNQCQANDISYLLSLPYEQKNSKNVEQTLLQRQLPPALYSSLQQLSLNQGVTLNVMLQFVWHKLLHIYSRQEVTLVGTTVSGRNLPIDGIEDSVGLYINTLPLRVDWDNDHSCLQQLQEIQRSLNELDEYCYQPLAELSYGGEALFHTLLVFENYPSADTADMPVRVRSTAEKTDYPLNLLAHTTDDGLLLSLAYANAYLTRDKADTLLSLLVTLLEHLPTHLYVPHHQLPLLRASKPVQAPTLALDSAFDYRCALHQRFMDWALEHPDDIAVIDALGSCSYGELYQAALVLSNQIRQCAKRDSALVAILMDKGRAQVIAILATLMAGKAYQPMDKSWPEKRRLTIVEQAEIGIVLCDEPWQHPAFTSLVLDSTGKALGIALPESLLAPQPVEPDALAYVIFTSGSTGVPKGVAISHAAITNTVIAMNNLLNVGTDDATFAVSALSFDVSVYDIFGMLSAGGRVVLPTESQRYQPQAWYQLLLQHQVTVWFSTPAFFDLLLQHKEQYASDSVSPLRSVILGGDWVSPMLAQRCFAWGAQCRFLNCWGVTEVAICSTMYEVGKTEQFQQSIPLGPTLANQSLYVLDAELKPLPQGVVGELYIGGVGLAQGYFNDTERTTERFIFHPMTGERLYRTGDLGRTLEDGNIQFLGRIDNQVKLNGYRIELGEIERTLSAVPEIGQCVALVTESNPRILLYYTASQEMDHTYLHELLAQTLPEYMRPADMIPLESFPLSVNGKVDRRALPIPEQSVAQKAYTAPSTEWETLCCDLWAEILRAERIGVDDNFYSSGGNSIQAITLCNRLSQALGREVTFAMLSAYPTVRQFCQHLEQQTAVNAAGPIAALAQTRYPLSSSQMRLWFLDELMQGNDLYQVPVLFELGEEINVDAYLLALQAVVTRHHLLRSTIVQNADDGTTQFVLQQRPLPLERLHVTAEEWETTLAAVIHRPFDLRKEYPLRHMLIERRETDGRVTRFSLLNVHHIAFDGWSANLLLAELEGHYAFFACDTPLTLPELTIQYSDYASWLESQLGNERDQARQQFWLDKMQGYQLLELPTDYPRPKEFDHRGATVSFDIDLELSEQLRSLARTTGVTLHAVLLAGFTLLLGKYSHQQDIVIGAPVANRSHSQIEPLIGLFVNTLVLRNTIDPELRVDEMIRQVFSNTVASQEYQDMPLEKLVESLNVERDLSRQPLFQVVFSVEQVMGAQQEKAIFTPLDLNHYYQVAKFDLGLMIEDGQPQLAAYINYACALFSPETIDRFMQHYRQLLRYMVQAPTAKVANLSLLSGEEQRKLLQPALETRPSAEYAHAIHHGFMAWAKQHPNDIALIDSQGSCTYGELYQLALVLSNQIRQGNLGSSALIAVAMDKGRAQMVAVFAVLMAGRAYLPMDTSWPENRRASIMQQAGCRLVLADRPWQQEAFTTIYLLPSGVAPTLAVPEVMLPPETVAPEQLAYVIFTSGSTGVPKGVAIQHAAANNTLIDVNQRLKIVPGDATLAISALSFDLSVYDIFGLLSAGGRLVIPSEKQRYQPDAWCHLMLEHRVTLWQSAPALFELLMQYVEREKLQLNRSLSRVMLSGDWIPVNLPQRCHRWAPDCRFISAGGATEAAIWSIMYEVEKGALFQQSIPYGQALANQCFYILDEHLVPVPPGIIGELFIGGVGLAQGYFNDPARTAERFIKHPVTGERLYRTGDLGRWLHDGNIEFCGRVDNQVKVNGYRVELGEIENTLMEIGAIKQCLVVKAMGEQERLIAYYVSDTPLDHSRLLTHVQGRLPMYMVPAAFIFLTEFTLNANGKIDRKRLPLPADDDATRQYVAPETEQERQLCALWQEVLQREVIGVTDDFFASGGSSILAISLCQKMSSLLAETVPVVKLFKYRTIRSMLAVENYQSVQRLNRYQPGAGNLWMIHPALVGCETYINFAKRVEGEINCLGVDNYNLYHCQQQLTDLSSVAAYYLAQMESQGLLEQPVIQLLGWSLGGLIALEIAAMLEARGVRDIQLYLLDSYYQAKVNYQDMPDLRKNMLAELGVHGEGAKRALAVEDAENAIGQGQTSGRLRHTEVTLFKATQMSAYYQALAGDKGTWQSEDNGVGAVCDRLNIIPLACNHHNILDCVDEIRRVIKPL